MSPETNNPLAAVEPATLELYKKLLTAIKKIGKFKEEKKKASIHLVRDSAFVGVHPRKQFLILTLKSDHAIQSKRIFKSEQVSKSRWHHEVKLLAPSEIDRELIMWMSEAYSIS